MAWVCLIQCGLARRSFSAVAGLCSFTKSATNEKKPFTTTLSELAALKQDAKDFGWRQMVREREKRATLEPLYRAAKALLPKLEISQQNLNHYASLANFYTIYDLRRMKAEQANLYSRKYFGRGKGVVAYTLLCNHVPLQGWTGRTDLDIEISNQCGRLIANAIVFYKSAILSRLLQKFEASGNEKALAVVKSVSPAAWRHVHLNGHYTFRGDGQAIDLDAIIKGLDLE